MASVVTDGAFSLFPGVDRTLSILEGEGLSLSVEGHDAVNLRIDSEPYGFPADLPTKARLNAGPVADLNVMTRRDRYVHRVARQVGQRFELDARQATVLAMGLGTLGSEGGDIMLHSLDAIVLDHGQQVVLIADRMSRCSSWRSPRQRFNEKDQNLVFALFTAMIDITC